MHKMKCIACIILMVSFHVEGLNASMGMEHKGRWRVKYATIIPDGQATMTSFSKIYIQVISTSSLTARFVLIKKTRLEFF